MTPTIQMKSNQTNPYKLHMLLGKKKKNLEKGKEKKILS